MTLSELVKAAHANARNKGFHDKPMTFGDRIALVHSEVSEALEWFRECGETGIAIRSVVNGKPEGIPSELADVVIRVVDICGLYGIDLETAIADKMAYNATREHRHGGKHL